MSFADRCPGVLRPHPAEDGAVVRLRIPGGRTTGTVLAGVAGLSQRYGNGEVQLTTRASLQIRGLPEPVPAALVEAIAGLGLLPSATHDRVRNIVASPLTGLAGGRADLRGMIAELDRALLAEPELAELSGRFLFALDDGRGDVSELPFNLCYVADSPAGGQVMDGSRQRLTATSTDAVPTLIRRAHEVVAGATIVPAEPTRERPVWPPLGAVAGAASVAVPLGQLTPEQSAAVCRVASDGPVIITPWRGLIIPGSAAGLSGLLETGLVADGGSGWALVSACVGAPHCARTGLDTRAVAVDLVNRGVTERVHVSGCDRRCGAPRVPHRELVPR